MLMRINLMYATYSSGTQTVADHIQATLTAHGHRVRLVEIRDFVPGDIDADLLLFGSPSWQRANFKYAYLFHEKENQALLDRWIDILPLK